MSCSGGSAGCANRPILHEGRHFAQRGCAVNSLGRCGHRETTKVSKAVNNDDRTNPLRRGLF